MLSAARVGKGSGSTELAQGHRAQALPIPTQEPAQKQFSNCRSPRDAPSGLVSHGPTINVINDVGGSIGQKAGACRSSGVKAGP